MLFVKQINFIESKRLIYFFSVQNYLIVIDSGDIQV